MPVPEPAPVQFEFVSLLIGLLLGMITMLLLVWLAYFSRAFVFSFCPTTSRPCAGADYYNDPGNALAHNPQLTPADILFLNNNNEMFYKRVPRVGNCTPEANQTVQIVFPQYCSFTGTGGVAGATAGSVHTWRETAFGSNIYKPDGFTGNTLSTLGNCDPVLRSSVSSGIPLIEWDSNPIVE